MPEKVKWGPSLRTRLVDIALEWQERYGVSPQVTSSISELDASQLLQIPAQTFAKITKDRSAVTKGFDFIWEDVRYQVKVNRPSGRPGSKVTLVPKARNYEWDKLIWILYNRHFDIEEAWIWDVGPYRQRFDAKKRLSPDDYRKGKELLPIVWGDDPIYGKDAKQKHIPSEDLTTDLIPNLPVFGELPDMNEEMHISKFCITFSGYEYWGSSEKYEEIAHGTHWETLDEMRTKLFHHQRACRHLDQPLFASNPSLMYTLIERIRDEVGQR